MGIRISNEELARRLESYAMEESSGEKRPSTTFVLAMCRLVEAGCDQGILEGLARAHCLTPVKKFEYLLNPELGEFAESLEQCNKSYWALIHKIGEFGDDDARRLLDLLKLERLIPLLAYDEGLRNLSELQVPIQAKIRIYLPLLCLYVRQVTGKNHYADLAAILRAFFTAAETKRKKEDITGGAVRKADSRFRMDNPEAYERMETAVITYRNLPPGAIRERPPHYVLLAFSYREMGSLLGSPAAEDSSAA